MKFVDWFVELMFVCSGTDKHAKVENVVGESDVVPVWKVFVDESNNALLFGVVDGKDLCFVCIEV